MKRWLGVVLAVGVMMAGCAAEPSVKGPLVYQKDAVELAKTEYHLREVKDVQIRPLDDAEWKWVPAEAKDKTPVYWVIEGIAESGEKARVFVSSNEKGHHFKR